MFSRERITSEVFCSGMFAASQGLFPLERREQILGYLRAGDVDILYAMAPGQTVLNYMIMKMKFSVINLARVLPGDRVTGCCVTSTHFVAHGPTLLDHGKPLTYLHYIGLSSLLFAKLCLGTNVVFPYRDLFLYYRDLHQPAERPAFGGQRAIRGRGGLIARLMSRLGFMG